MKQKRNYRKSLLIRRYRCEKCETIFECVPCAETMEKSRMADSRRDTDALYAFRHIPHPERSPRRFCETCQ